MNEAQDRQQPSLGNELMLHKAKSLMRSSTTIPHAGRPHLCTSSRIYSQRLAATTGSWTVRRRTLSRKGIPRASGHRQGNAKSMETDAGTHLRMSVPSVRDKIRTSLFESMHTACVTGPLRSGSTSAAPFHVPRPCLSLINKHFNVSSVEE